MISESKILDHAHQVLTLFLLALKSFANLYDSPLLHQQKSFSIFCNNDGIPFLQLRGLE